MLPLSEAHRRLGRALQRARERHGVSTRQVPSPSSLRPFYSSGHISLVENGYTSPSYELVEAYVAFSGSGAKLRALYVQMQAAAQRSARERRAGGQNLNVTQPLQQGSSDLSRAEIQQHYLIESHDAQYFFAENGSIKELRCTVKLRAKKPGVQLYYAGHSYGADPRRGVLAITAEAGARIEAARESESGAIQTIFALDRPLSPEDDDPHTVSFLLEVNSSVRSIPRLRYHATDGNQNFQLTANFSPQSVPDRFWWFEVPDAVDAEHPSPAHQLPPALLRYHRSFEALIPSWCYGFAWSWA